MKKIIVSLFLICCLFSALYAQKPSEQRLRDYQRIKQQQEELLSWCKEHPFSNYWSVSRRKNEVKKLQQQLYRDFKDVELWYLRQDQQYVKESNELFPQGIPYVSNNLFPKENLQRLYKQQPELFEELLVIYPGNIASVDAEILLDIMAQDESFEKYIKEYLFYLRSFRQDPDCVKNMPENYKKQLAFVEGEQQQKRIISVLASSCQRCLFQRQKHISAQELAHNLRTLNQ